MQLLLVLLFLGRRGNEGSINLVCICVAREVLVVDQGVVIAFSRVCSI
jgi:hypothetical protein